MNSGFELGEDVYKDYKPYKSVRLSDEPVPDYSGELEELFGIKDRKRTNIENETKTEQLQLQESPDFPIDDIADFLPSKSTELKPFRILAKLFTEKVNLLKVTIDEIYGNVREREKLNEKFTEQIEEEIKQCEILLNDIIPPKSSLNDPNISRRRAYLERELINLKKEWRENKLRHWRELIWIKKEIRNLLPEYEILTRTKEILDL